MAARAVATRQRVPARPDRRVLTEGKDLIPDDLIPNLQMLANIAKRLEYLHSHGFVHRDLKPSNVMWLPRENRWTLIDFGCAARIGRPASISFSLRYAAPEVIEALTLGAREMTPHPSLDSWSLGVLAFELLTGAPAFDLLQEGPAEARNPPPTPPVSTPGDMCAMTETLGTVCPHGYLQQRVFQAVLVHIVRLCMYCDHDPEQQLRPRTPAAAARPAETCLILTAGELL